MNYLIPPLITITIFVLFFMIFRYVVAVDSMSTTFLLNNNFKYYIRRDLVDLENDKYIIKASLANSLSYLYEEKNNTSDGILNCLSLTVYGEKFLLYIISKQRKRIVGIEKRFIVKAVSNIISNTIIPTSIFGTHCLPDSIRSKLLRVEEIIATNTYMRYIGLGDFKLVEVNKKSFFEFIGGGKNGKRLLLKKAKAIRKDS